MSAPLPGSSAGRALLERHIPYRELSVLVRRDRRSTDPVLAAHRWWARRPPALFRGLLLAANLPETTSPELFWRKYATDSAHLDNVTVYDAFAGGGTTLVEAARLGAIPYGTDVDPIAVAIVRHALERPSAGTVLPL